MCAHAQCVQLQVSILNCNITDRYSHSRQDHCKIQMKVYTVMSNPDYATLHYIAGPGADRLKKPKQILPSGKKSGIPTNKQYLVYQNRPLYDTSIICDGSTVHVLLKLLGGSEECSICSFPGEFLCSECNEQTTCKECCMRIHKHPKKAEHKPHKLDQNVTAQTAPNSSTYNTANMSLSDDIDNIEDDDEFMFSDSPTLNEHAARVATPAECFNLTKFMDFQRKVIDNTMSGKDSIVVQPTVSGKSLCYQIPPVYKNKKALVVSPTISTKSTTCH